ncbi:PspC domain-containing protein [Streptomyces sp. NPDC002514]|uniref:PspC domain-containing protein n=1 Tax=Streptomyces sp. NPDC001270 TaxID=3364554 RepID=UPI0036B79642
MTDHDHAATGPGPGPGPRPAPGSGPPGAAPAAADTSGARGDTGAPGTEGTTGEGAGPLVGDGVPPLRAFRRDRRHRVLAGICSGLGRHTDMDPVIFRITLAVLAASGGVGLIFYGFAWLFVSYDDEEENEVRKLLTGRVDGQALAAVLFALVGCGVFLAMLRNGGVLTFAVVVSLLLAGAGYWSQRRGVPDPDPSPSSRQRSGRGGPVTAPVFPDAPPEAQAPPAPPAYPSWWRDPIVKDGTHVGGTGYLWGPGDAVGADPFRPVGPGVFRDARGGGRAPRPAVPRPRGPRWIGGWIFLLALLAGGLGTGAMWDGHPLGTSLQTGLACALAVFGLGIAVSAFLGRTGAGSVFLALVTAALLAGSAALPKDITTHWRTTSWQPAAVAEVRPKYDLGTGVGTLDLTGVRLTEGQTLSTRAQVGVGRLRVVVPPDATVRLSVDVGVGDIQLPGDGKEDMDVAPGKHKEVTLSPTTPSGKNGKSGGTLDVDLQVGVGQVEVSRAGS